MSDVPKIMEAYPDLPSGFTEVKQGSWETAQLIDGEQPLGTLGVYSCCVIAVRNTETARIYLGHFFHPSSNKKGAERQQFDSMVDAIAINEDRVHALDAWVGGASLFGGGLEVAEIHDEEVRQDKLYVIERLKTLENLAALEEEWLGQEEAMSIVTFHPMRKPEIEFVHDVRKPDSPE